MKLEIELVPSSSFFNNLRSVLKKNEWDKIRKEVYKDAGYKCEICCGKGKNHPVECHEIWEYDNGVQKLVRLIALCPSCHTVKHIGLAKINGYFEVAIKHLCKINKISKSEAYNYVNNSFDVWHERSNSKWKLDLSYIEEKYGIKVNKNA